MATEKEKVKVIVVEPVSQLVQELIDAQSSREDIEFQKVNNGAEAAQVAMVFLPCMLLACVQDNKDIPATISMLKSCEGGIKYGRLKSMIVSKIKNKQLTNLISGLGVTDFIEEPAPARTLVFKSNLQIKAIDTIRKQEEAKRLAKEKTVFKSSQDGSQGNANTANDPNKPKSKEALKLGEDMFLFKKGNASKVGKKSVIEVEGPDPASGEWVQHEDKGEAKAAWRWMPNEEKAKPKEQQKNEGWVHEGDKPAFNPKTKKWQLASEKPDLSYKKDGKKLGSKISTNASGELEIAEDSPQAEANINKIAMKWNPQAAKADANSQKANPNQNEKDSAASAEKSVTQKLNVDAKAEQKLYSEKNEQKVGKELSLKEKEGQEKSSKELNYKDKKKPDSGKELSLKDKKKPEKPGKDFIDSKEDSDSAGPEGEKSATQKLNVDAKAQQKLFEEKEGKKVSSVEAGKQSLDWESEKGDFNNRLTGEKQAGNAKKKTEEEKKKEQTFGKQAKEKKRPAGESKADALKRLLGELGDDDGEEESDSDQPSFKQKKKKPASEDDRAARLARLKEKTKDEKKSIELALQEELEKPLPAELTAEEAAEIREELGITDPNVSAKELARKRKFDRLKALKERLKDVDADIGLLGEAEKEAPEHNTHDLNAEDPENTWSKKKIDNTKPSGGKFSARDSDQSEKEREESEKKRKKDNAETKKKHEVPPGEPEFYRDEQEVMPLGGAWESTGAYYVYLDAITRYKGFQDIQSILPLWVHHSDHVPELIAKTKKWRFYTREPIHAKVIAEIPLEVVDFLNELKKTIELNAKEKGPSKEDRLAALKDRMKAVKEKNNPTEEGAEENAEAPAADDPQIKNAKTVKEQAEIIEQKKKALQEKLAASKTEVKEIEKQKEEERATAKKEIQEKIAAAQEAKDAEKEATKAEKKAKEEAEAPSFGAKKKDKPERDDKADRLAALKDKLGKEDKKSRPEAAAEVSEAEADKEDNDADAPSFGAKKKDKPERDDKADRLAALKDKLGKEDKKSKPEVATLDAKKKEKLAKDEKAKQESSAGKVEAKLTKKSPALQKFFERRKERQEEDAATEQNSGSEAEARIPNDPKIAYLGIYVALSDAVYLNREFPRTAARLARAIAGSIQNCHATFLAYDGTSGNGKILGSSNTDYTINENLDASNFYLISLSESKGDKKLLGYLALEPTQTRKEFTQPEKEALEKACAMVAQIWETRQNDIKEKQAA